MENYYFIGNDKYYLYFNEETKKLQIKNKISIDNLEDYLFKIETNKKIHRPNLYFLNENPINADDFYSFNLIHNNYIFYPEIDENDNIYIETKIIDSEETQETEKINRRLFWILKKINLENINDLNETVSINIKNENNNKLNFGNLLLYDIYTDKNYSLNIDYKTHKLNIKNIRNLNLNLMKNYTSVNYNSLNNLNIVSLYSPNNVNLVIDKNENDINFDLNTNYESVIVTQIDENKIVIELL